MLSEDKYFKTLTDAELWQRYCGFLDLSIDEFMAIQNELLMDQIELVADSVLGKKIMGNQKPKSVEEFRQVVPLTTYDDYEPYLSERREDVLAVKPYVWTHSAGTGGVFKWFPHSLEIMEKAVRTYLTFGILASCSRRGELNFRPGARLLGIVAPPPYSSGTLVQAATQRFSLHIMPPLEGAEDMQFQERMNTAFKTALRSGVDIVGAIASILVRIGEEFTGQAQSVRFSASMLHPKVAFRLLKAWLRSKRERRPILPKDLWQPKGILVSGVDTSIYKDSVAYYWGVVPLELYGGTESPAYAVQGWNKKYMVFLPDFVFLEFIPYEEVMILEDNNHYRPSTVLLNELEEGKLYEVVITHFYGMPLLRYRLNDIIKVVATKDEETGVRLPQITFQRRVREVINIGGLATLDEKTLWQAIANTGIKYTDWTACKEYSHDQSFLRIYLELKEEKDAANLETMIDQQLKQIDTDYKDIGAYLGIQPVKITILAPGTFQRYTEERIKEGADLAHLKPNHINAPETTIKRLVQLNDAISER